MGLMDTVRGWLIKFLELDEFDQVARQRAERIAEQRDYYAGTHKKQLKVKARQYDDNLTVNLCGLIVDKAVSALVGDPDDGYGLSWTFPSETGDTTPPQIVWLDEQWERNEKELFIHKNALQGATTGIPAIKIVPDGAGNLRLVNINPLLLSIVTDPQDQDTVLMYVIRYIVEENGKQVAYKEETAPANDERTAWTIETKRQVNGNRWDLVTPPVLWEYDFPPILVWQNLPVCDSPYGRSDIEGIIPLQDRYNFMISNLSKIVRLYAHPNRYARNLSAQINPEGLNMGPDEMLMFGGDGEIVQLPPVADLPGAMQFLDQLRQSAFMLSREIDTASLKDKVGAITNFALRVLYRDFLDKLGTKRMLYGNAYTELNRRMLILGGFEGEECVITWPEPLPVNETEEVSALEADMRMGIVSKQTAQEKRGYDPEQEAERMAEETSASDNAGAEILNRLFNRTEQPGQAGQFGQPSQLEQDEDAG